MEGGTWKYKLLYYYSTYGRGVLPRCIYPLHFRLYVILFFPPTRCNIKWYSWGSISVGMNAVFTLRRYKKKVSTAWTKRRQYSTECDRKNTLVFICRISCVAIYKCTVYRWASPRCYNVTSMPLRLGIPMKRFLKKNINTSKPPEHSPSGECQKKKRWEHWL